MERKSGDEGRGSRRKWDNRGGREERWKVREEEKKIVLSCGLRVKIK